MIDKHQWFSVHLYYYDEQKDKLILHCIQPLFQEAKAVTRRLFFVRHWVRGPHLRLNFFCTPEEFTTSIKPLVEEKVGSYLRDNPSTTTLDEEHLRPVYEQLAQQEMQKGPVLPLLPDNSFYYVPYDRRLYVLKSPLLADLLEDFYSQTNNLVFEMLTSLGQGHNLLALSLDLLYTTAHMLSPHITRSFLSYRSHAEAFIISCPQPQTVRALFEQKYKVQASALIQHLPRLLEALEQKEERFPFTLPWGLLIQSFQARAQPLFQSGQLDGLPPVDSGSSTLNNLVIEHLEQSAFHQKLESQPEYKKRLYAHPQFQCYRLMLNMLYLHLNRLGLRPVERFMLCHLVANTVEDVFHVNAVEMLAPSQKGDKIFHESMTYIP